MHLEQSMQVHAMRKNPSELSAYIFVSGELTLLLHKSFIIKGKKALNNELYK